MRSWKCLYCVDGKVPVYSLVDDTSENVIGWVDCYICHGTGEVEDECDDDNYYYGEEEQ